MHCSIPLPPTTGTLAFLTKPVELFHLEALALGGFADSVSSDLTFLCTFRFGTNFFLSAVEEAEPLLEFLLTRFGRPEAFLLVPAAPRVRSRLPLREGSRPRPRELILMTLARPNCFLRDPNGTLTSVVTLEFSILRDDNNFIFAHTDLITWPSCQLVIVLLEKI